MTNGLLIVFYLPNLDDEDLAVAIAWVRRLYDHAPRLCGWLVDQLCDEQVRRLASLDSVPRETDVLLLRAERWSSRDLREAVVLVTSLTYSVRNEAVGKLFDALVLPIQAALNARLERLEQLSDASHQAA